jgi:hypothetical protein
MIKEYIQFAIDNGYIFDSMHDYRELDWIDCETHIYFKNKSSPENAIEIITSKPFIEAIARGLIKDVKKEGID